MDVDMDFVGIEIGSSSAGVWITLRPAPPHGVSEMHGSVNVQGRLFIPRYKAKAFAEAILTALESAEKEAASDGR